MATDGTNAGEALPSTDRIIFRCHACAVHFPDEAIGPGTCPRCGAIGGHDRLGRAQRD